MSFTVLVSATSARAPSSNIPHQFRKHSPLITSEALNLPPPPPPSAGTHSPFKGRFSVTRNEFKMHFYGRNKYLDIDLWLQGYNSVFYIFYGSILRLLHHHYEEFDRASRDQNGILVFLGGVFVFWREQKGLWVFSLIQIIEEKAWNLEQRMFFEVKCFCCFFRFTCITAADFSSVFISFSPCCLIILQDSKKTCDPEGLLVQLCMK